MEELKIPHAGGDEPVCRAVTDEGIVVPVIDVTHAAFHVDMSEDQLAAAMEEAVAAVRTHASLPADQRHAHMESLRDGSFLAPRIAAARGGVLDGLSTYFLKLGPDNLGDYARPMDRLIARSMPCLSCRIRMQNMAGLIAQALEPLLEEGPGRPVHFLNVAGGPGMDSLNALIVTRRRRPDLLRGRSLVIHVLDVDESGPRFGARALAALSANGAPLDGLSVDHEYVPFDWSRPAALHEVLRRIPASSVLAGSSEGGLFDYAADDEISAVLAAVGSRMSSALFAGSISRGDGAARVLNEAGGAAIRLRAPEEIEVLAGAAGWRLLQAAESPLSRELLLRSTGRP